MGMFLSLGSMVRTGWFAIPAILFCCSLVGFGQEPQLGNKAGSVEQSDRTSEPVSGSEAEDGLGVHGYAKSGSVRIHYVALGDGPLLIMIHGFPDYWYTWREQMPELSKHFRVVAIDSGATTTVTSLRGWRITGSITSCPISLQSLNTSIRVKRLL